MEVSRFDVLLVALDPAVGHEIKKTRPCTVISPDEMNHNIGTVIIAPMTTKGRDYPTRVPCTFQGVAGQVVLDQMRTVDKARLVKRLGRLPVVVADRVEVGFTISGLAKSSTRLGRRRALRDARIPGRCGPSPLSSDRPR
jgi:mRNA interferase MazF